MNLKTFLKNLWQKILKFLDNLLRPVNPSLAKRGKPKRSKKKARKIN